MAEKNVSYTFIHDEKIFSDGVHLIPIEITKKNGKVVLMWVVDSFDGDAYDSTGNPVSPKSSSDEIDDLVYGADEDEDE